MELELPFCFLAIAIAIIGAAAHIAAAIDKLRNALEGDE